MSRRSWLKRSSTATTPKTTSLARSRSVLGPRLRGSGGGRSMMSVERSRSLAAVSALRALAAAGGGLAALQPKGDLAADLVTEVLEALAGPLGRELLAVQLLRELFRARGRVRVDPGLSRRWAAKAGVRGL
mmetsp:Transcript_60520/g.176946  ORF Transcript_60520/g.176946 Transcript_60520/m.176946 type:complete len:131 (+) Transcript_60520:998-1390(+)